MNCRNGNFGYLLLAAAAAFAAACSASGQDQTYKLNGGSAPPSQAETAPKAKPESQPQSSEKGLGWGSNIQNARLAHAAETALRQHQFAAAADYARRAAEGAPNDPQLWFLLGYTARLAGEPQLSVDAYSHGLRVNPSSLEGLSGLAQTYSSVGRKGEAEALLERILAVDSTRTDDLRLLGEMFLQSGQYDEALSPLERAEHLRPGARSEILLALAHQRLNQLDEAKRYLDMAKRAAPNSPELARSLAAFYRETGNYGAAITVLKGIRAPASDVKAELAYTYQLDDNSDQAAKLYADAAQSAPRDLNLQLAAAQAQLNIGAVAAAKDLLMRAARVDPEHYRLYAIRADIARLEERNQDAIAEYETVLAKLPPASPDGELYPIQLHMNLMELHQRLHDEAGTKKELAIAQSQIANLDLRGRNRVGFLRLRAVILLSAGDTEGALRDVNEALGINTHDPHALQLDGDVLAKMGRREEAIGVYKKVLAIDPVDRSALTSLGSVSRELGRDREAEKYFQRLVSVYPKSYAAHLALGDLYTARRDFAAAQTAYSTAYGLAPYNSMVIAGGANAAIESHQLPLAAQWLARATPEIQKDPQVLRETERYLSWTGNYKASADAGLEAIQKLPVDRDVVVYLGYDFLHLERYDELLQLTARYQELLPTEPAIPLLAGYVYKHSGDLDSAQAAFTQSLERDPKVTTAHINRGYVLHDLHKPSAAAEDFEAAVRLDPGNGEAHLGLAYTSLDLHRPRIALEQAKLAEKELGDSMPLHLIRGTAYGEDGMLKEAAAEYRIALKNSPKDATLHLALGNTLYDLHEYRESIAELNAATELAPQNGTAYAQMALAYAQLGERQPSLRYLGLAEEQGPPTVYVSTGEALSLLGEPHAAMERFERALATPHSDRISVRLGIAQVNMKHGEPEDARRQIVLGLMEAASGRTLPATGSQLMQAADLLLAMHEYELAQAYFQRALAAAAPETDVRLGLANTYLALGDTPRAQAQLASIRSASQGSEPSYQFLLTEANLYRQQHQSAQALTAFAQAAESSGENPLTERELLRAGADEGMRINRDVSVLSDFSVSPIFEDTTIYALDARLLKAPNGLLPAPRSSLETQSTGAYRLHLHGMPDAGGYFQIRNARGSISLPSANQIINRDTTDYSFNFALNPTFRLGNNAFNLSAGFQTTLRRDSQDPFDMNQNLFRQFIYVATSSFNNWVSVRGFAMHEAGPFTNRPLRSRDLAGSVEFRVGRPWAKTALVTGWGARDEQFVPIIREFYTTSTYAGIEHQFTDNLRIRGVGEYIRSWRVQGRQFAIAQAFHPAGSVEYAVGKNWNLDASAAYSRNMGFHAYDAIQSRFAVSYGLPIHRRYKQDGKTFPLSYPIRFAAGLQQESFFNFASGNNQQFKPFVSINVF